MITVIIATYMIITTPFGSPTVILFDSMNNCLVAQGELLHDYTHSSTIGLYQNVSVVCVEK